MKFKFLLSLLFAAAGSAYATAQDCCGPKWTDNIYVNFGVGGMTVINDGINSPTLNAHIQVGKYITPTWGVRAELGGLWQSLEKQEIGYEKYCKKFGELNLDATRNLNRLFGNKNVDRPVNVYVFGGPTISLSSAVSRHDVPVYSTSQVDGKTVITVSNTHSFKSEGAKLRAGATVGMGLGFRLSNAWALNVEGRYGVAPSIFGNGSDCSKAESTLRGTVGITYVFGGLKGKKTCSMPMVPITEPKTVIKEVEKVVTREVPKEVVKEVTAYSPIAVVFKINKWDITDESMINIKLMADAMKKNPNAKFKITGYADKGTGSVSRNKFLSEKRAEAVYNALVKQGVNPSQLEKVAMGGVDPMFFDKAYLSRVVVLESK